MKFTPAIVFALAILANSQFAYANALNVAIDCKSADGLMVISADLPGDDKDASIAIESEKVKTSIANQEAIALAGQGDNSVAMRLANSTPIAAQISVVENTQGYAVTALDKGVSIFALTSTAPLQLKIDKQYGDRQGEFTANLHLLGVPDAVLSCTYDYAP